MNLLGPAPNGFCLLFGHQRLPRQPVCLRCGELPGHLRLTLWLLVNDVVVRAGLHGTWLQELVLRRVNRASGLHRFDE